MGSCIMPDGCWVMSSYAAAPSSEYFMTVCVRSFCDVQDTSKLRGLPPLQSACKRHAACQRRSMLPLSPS